MPLLSVQDLRVSFHTRNGVYRAVGGVDFEVQPGEILGLVGESGSGKSVTCQALMGLLPRNTARIETGQALFDGLDLLKTESSVLRKIRGRRIAMVFQDPMSSLNPFLRIGDQLEEPLRIHGLCSGAEARAKALAALEAVGINDAERRLRQHPHELSGGMRQRVMIAMALITEPELLIADEPTTALDVTVQAQILDIIRRLQKERGMSVIYITHDLAVVAELCDRVQVMYAGRLVESASVETLIASPKHPYTQALQHSIPSLQRKGEPLHTLPGLPPNLSAPLPGCAFAARCPKATPACALGEAPQGFDIGPGHRVACTRVQKGEI